MLATVAYITYRSTGGLEESAQWVAHRHDFLDQIGSFELHLMEVDSAARGYLLAADEQYLPAYEHARQGLVADMRGIEASVATGQYEQPEARDPRAGPRPEPPSSPVAENRHPQGCHCDAPGAWPGWRSGHALRRPG